MLTVITNRLLCNGDFFEKIEEICRAKPTRIVLREKDMAHSEYSILAKRCKVICDNYGIQLVINSFIDIARQLKISNIHLPYHVFMKNKDKLEDFTEIGVSIHSPEEAYSLIDTSCTYIIAGHIFDTDCKKGVPSRGLEYLNSVCKVARQPVFAIGGITEERLECVYHQGASGVCVMSEIMESQNTIETVQKFIK